MYYFLESEGLYCEEEFVAEFCPNVIGVESCYDLDSGEEKRCFLVNVTLKNGKSTECKKVEDINRLSFFNLWDIPDHSINAAQRKKLIHKMQMDVFDIINEKVQKADGRGRYKKIL